MKTESSTPQTRAKHRPEKDSDRVLRAMQTADGVMERVSVVAAVLRTVALVLIGAVLGGVYHLVAHSGSLAWHVGGGALIGLFFGTYETVVGFLMDVVLDGIAVGWRWLRGAGRKPEA